MKVENSRTALHRSRRSATVIDVHVGARVRLRRRICNLTQEELAARIDVSSQMIQKYEQGEARISASRLADMARTLNVGPGWFFEGSDVNYVHEAIDDDSTELLALFKEADKPHLKRKILALIRLMVRDEAS